MGWAAPVTFVEELDNLDPNYDNADVLFLASRLDPLPNVATIPLCEG